MKYVILSTFCIATHISADFTYLIQNQSKYSITVRIEGKNCKSRIDKVTAVIKAQDKEHSMKMTDQCEEYMIFVKPSAKNEVSAPLPKSNALIVVPNTTESLNPQAPLELSVQPLL